MKRIALWFFLVASVAGAQDMPTAIIHARLYTLAGPVVEDGTVLWKDGKILAAGNSVQLPQGTRTIDAAGKWVLPGFIDSNCHVGLEEISEVDATVDSSEETDPVTPQLLVTDGFFPESKLIGVARANGVVACVVSPAATNVFAGVSAWIEFNGKQVDLATFKERVAMNVSMGEAPKLKYGPENRMPQTRMGTAALIRATLWKAREYGERWKRYREKPSSSKAGTDNEAPDRDLGLEALQDVLNGSMPLVISAQRVDDIMTAIRIAEEFGLKKNLIISHATEAYKLADLLAREQIPVLLGPITTQPDTMETLGARYDAAAILHRAGVLFAIQTNDSHNVRNLPYEAALAVASGLPYEQALQAITLNVARIFKVDSQVGTLEPGKRANLILSDGDPLEPRTSVERVFIGGEEIPDDSYHRKLWEEFLRKTAVGPGR